MLNKEYWKVACLKVKSVEATEHGIVFYKDKYFKHILNMIVWLLANEWKRNKIQNAVATSASPPLEILDFNMMKFLI